MLRRCSFVQVVRMAEQRVRWDGIAGRAEDVICTACTPALLTIPHLQTHTHPLPIASDHRHTRHSRLPRLLFSLTCLTRTYDGVTHESVPLALHHGTQSFDPRRRSSYASHQDPGPDRRTLLKIAVPAVMGWDAMRGWWTRVVATHVRRQAILARRPLGCYRSRASSHRHETTCRSPDSLPFATPAPARPAHCFNVLCVDRARAARRHLGSSWHTTPTPIRTMQACSAVRER